MGFELESIRLLIKAKKLKVDFKNTLTIGRQRMLIPENKLLDLVKKEGLIKKREDFKIEKYAASFLELLGAEQAVSLDASDYEESEIIHDLNHPIPAHLKNKYSVVVDGGSLEHIFNFPVVIKNCMDLLEVGGHFLSITPTNNFMGHGFYQFSPELFFRVFNETNGFKLKKIYFYTRNGDDKFYEVANPANVQQRVGLVNSSPSFLFILAQKVEEKTIFQTPPQQYDYEHYLWKGVHKSKKVKRKKRFLWLRRLIFKLIITPSRKFRRTFKIMSKDTGTGNSKHFKQTE